jgi:hypothetical protein
MPDIVLQFSTQDTLGSRAIRLFQHGWATHVDAVMPDGWLLGARHSDPGIDNTGLILKNGVAVRPPSYRKFRRTLVMTLSTSEQIEADFWAFLGLQIGKPYDTTAITAFIFSRDWREDDSWFCSELVMAALEKAGFVQPLATTANRVTPEMLLFLCSAFESHPPC